MHYYQNPIVKMKSTDMVVSHTVIEFRKEREVEKGSRNSQNLEGRNKAQISKDEMQKKKKKDRR